MMSFTGQRSGIVGGIARVCLGVSALVLIGVVLSGCAGELRSDFHTIAVPADSYEQSFDSAMQALRHEQFVLDRVDRRLGVITTKPMPSSSMLEPLKFDNSTVGQGIEATMHDQRRVVRIEFRTPGEGATESGGSESDRYSVQVVPSPVPFEPGLSDGLLVMNVSCIIERGHQPNRQIPTTNMRNRHFTTDPALVEQGIKRRFWEPVGNDPYMEQRIAHRISTLMAEE